MTAANKTPTTTAASGTVKTTAAPQDQAQQAAQGADKPVKEAKPKVRNISQAAREAVRAGLSNADALAAVKKEFPDANTSMASIAWYRNDLRKKGETFASPKKEKAEKPAKPAKADAKADVQATGKPAANKPADAAPAGADEFE